MKGGLVAAPRNQTIRRPKRLNLVNTATLFVPAKPLHLRQGFTEQQGAMTGQRSLIRSKIEEEPEARLWKVCAEVTGSRLNVFEWIAFLLFGVVSVGALVCGFCELLHLLGSGALDQTVRALLTK